MQFADSTGPAQPARPFCCLLTESMDFVVYGMSTNRKFSDQTAP